MPRLHKRWGRQLSLATGWNPNSKVDALGKANSVESELEIQNLNRNIDEYSASFRRLAVGCRLRGSLDLDSANCRQKAVPQGDRNPSGSSPIR